MWQLKILFAARQAPAQSGGGSILGGIGSTIAQGGIQSLYFFGCSSINRIPCPIDSNKCNFIGMAFGTGSAMAHRAVDAVMGPRTIQHETVVSEAAAAAPASPMMNADACGNHSKAFQDVWNTSPLVLPNSYSLLQSLFATHLGWLTLCRYWLTPCYIVI